MSEEMLDVVDEEDNVVGVKTRTEVLEKNLRYRSVYFIVKNKNNEILITKRSMSKDKFPGLYEIPGGTVRSGEDYGACAKREIKEELGIEGVDMKMIFSLNYEDDDNNQIMKVYEVFYDGEIIPEEKEIEEFFYISVDELIEMIIKDPENFPKNRIAILEKYLDKKII